MDSSTGKLNSFLKIYFPYIKNNAKIGNACNLCFK